MQNDENQTETSQDDSYLVSWQASEYVHHEKDVLWFASYAVVALIVLSGTYLLLRDVVSIIVVALMAIAVLVYANRQPRSLSYQLDDHGVIIDGREYDYSSFKSFSVLQYGAVETIFLEPLERFMPPISIYFAPEDGEKITSILGEYLPYREKQPDLIDTIFHRLRI